MSPSSPCHPQTPWLCLKVSRTCSQAASYSRSRSSSMMWGAIRGGQLAAYVATSRTLSSLQGFMLPPRLQGLVVLRVQNLADLAAKLAKLLDRHVALKDDLAVLHAEDVVAAIEAGTE